MNYGVHIKKQQTGGPGIFWQRENEKKTDRKFGYKTRDQRFKIRQGPHNQENEVQYQNFLGTRIEDEEEKKPQPPQKDFIKKNRQLVGSKGKKPSEKKVETKASDPKTVTITQDQLNSILASMTKIAGGKEDNLRISIDGKKNEILIDSPRRNHSDDDRDHDDDYRYDTDDEKRHKQKSKKQTETKPKRKNKKEEDLSIFDLMNNTDRTAKESTRKNDDRKERKKKLQDDSDYEERQSVDYDSKRSRDRDQKRSHDKHKSKDRDRDYSEDRSYKHRSRDRKRSRERSRERKWSRDRSRGQHRDRRDSGDRRSKSRDRDSSYDRYDRHRDRYRSHSRDRDDRHRDRYRSHSPDDRHRDRHRSKSRDRDGSGDRDRHRRKKREKEQDKDKDEDTSKSLKENHSGDTEKKLTPREVAGIPLALPWKHMTKAEQMRLLAARKQLQYDEEKAEEKEAKEKKEKESRREGSSRRITRKKNRTYESREPSEVSGYEDRDSDHGDRYNKKEEKKKSEGLPPAVPKGHMTLAEKKREQWARERAESKMTEVTYTPWGKPGAGAPIRTDSGKVAADYKSRQVSNVSKVVANGKVFYMY